MGSVRRVVGAVGEAIVYGLIRLLGRLVRPEEVPWLAGPFGGEHIGDRPYEECGRREGLTVTRHAERGGLIPDFGVLAGPSFDPARAPAAVRDFYQNTASYRMDVWTRSWFPANVALWLMVATISRRVDQLNFPVDALETAMGMDSEIVLLAEPDGVIRYTGWFRRLVKTGRVLYTGFYMTDTVPGHPSRCVKVVFPMPDGNATVLLRPELGDDGSFLLDSSGRGFGDVGFYRIQRTRDGRWRIWRVQTLHERFRLYVDFEGVVRCDHTIRFLGLPVVQLHFRIERKAAAG